MSNQRTTSVVLLCLTAAAVACNDNGSPSQDSGTTGDASIDSPVSEGSTPDAKPVGDAGVDGTVSNESGTDAMPMSTDGALEGASDSGAAPGVVALPGYTVTIFATGGTTYSHPDSIELDGTHVWVGYNMGVKSKDGTDAGAPYGSTVVEYNLDGSLAGKSFAIPGHCDGVRVDPATHIVWATSNEDGNPILMSYDPSSGTSKTFSFATPPGHGGGLDDLAFINGQLIVADSNPTPNDAGLLLGPALSAIHVSGSTVSFTPVLMGNAMAHNPYSNTDSALSLSDPDSMSIDDKGDLVLVDQADSQILVIKNPGSGPDAGGAQSVTVYPVGTQLDDTVWVTKATGMLLVADEVANTIYAVQATFTPGTIFTETPNDSSIPGIVGTIDLAGQPQPGPTYAPVTPVILGLKKPTGLLFVPR
jgi:hypothetical protein